MADSVNVFVFYYMVDNLEPSYNIRLFTICYTCICSGNPGTFWCNAWKNYKRLLCIIHNPGRLPLAVDQSSALAAKYIVIGFQICYS